MFCECLNFKVFLIRKIGFERMIKANWYKNSLSMNKYNIDKYSIKLNYYNNKIVLNKNTIFVTFRIFLAWKCKINCIEVTRKKTHENNSSSKKCIFILKSIKIDRPIKGTKSPNRNKKGQFIGDKYVVWRRWKHGYRDGYFPTFIIDLDLYFLNAIYQEAIN